jgi:hypothetical protein
VRVKRGIPTCVAVSHLKVGSYEFESEVCLLDLFAGLAVRHAAGFSAGRYGLHLYKQPL